MAQSGPRQRQRRVWHPPTCENTQWNRQPIFQTPWFFLRRGPLAPFLAKGSKPPRKTQPSWELVLLRTADPARTSLLCCLPAASELAGGSLPSPPAPFGNTLFPSQATSGGHRHSNGDFQLPSIQHIGGVSVPLHPSLQTPSVLAQPGHSTAPAANPRPYIQDGACWVNVFPITSRWPLFLWKKPNHLVIIFP